MYREFICYAASLRCNVEVSTVAQILRSIQANAVQLVIAAIAADGAKQLIIIYVGGFALLVVEADAGNPAVIIHTVEANLCAPVAVAHINCVSVVAVLAAEGFCPDAVAFHMCAQQVATINYVRCIITPGKHCTRRCCSCALHQGCFIITGNIDTAAGNKAAYAAMSAVKGHIADPAGNAGGGQSGSNHRLALQIIVKAGIIISEFFAQCA